MLIRRKGEASAAPILYSRNHASRMLRPYGRVWPMSPRGVQSGEAPLRSFLFPLSQRGTEGDSEGGVNEDGAGACVRNSLESLFLERGT
jgi:hypothetical protein